MELKFYLTPTPHPSLRIISRLTSGSGYFRVHIDTGQVQELKNATLNHPFEVEVKLKKT